MVLSQRGKHIKIEKSRRTDKRQKRTHYTVIVECRKDIDGFETDKKVTKMDGEKEGQSRQVFAVNTTTQRAYSVNAHPCPLLLLSWLSKQHFFTIFLSRFLSVARCILWVCVLLGPAFLHEREREIFPFFSLSPLPSWLRLDVRSLGRYLSLLVIVIVLASAPSTFCWREVSLNILGENQLK